MRLACPSCLHTYDFPVDLIRNEPFIAHCAACGGAFLIGPAGVVSGPDRAHDPVAGEPAPDAPAADATEGDPARDYLIIRGRAVAQTNARRRVVFVSGRAADDPRPARAARVVAHAAGFRRAVRAAEPERVVPVVPSPAPADSAGSARGEWTGRALLVVSVVAASVLAGVGGFAFRALTSLVPSNAVPAAAPLPVASAPATAGSDTLVQFARPDRLGPPDPGVEKLHFDVLDVQAFPAVGAVAIFATVLNGGGRAFADLQFDVRLLADGVPARRRDVWCCDDLAAESVPEVAQDFGHLHFQMRRSAATLEVVRPGEARAFTAVFQGVDAPTLSRKLGAEIRVAAARPLAESAEAAPVPASDTVR